VSLAAFQNVPPAPGRESGTAQPAPPPTEPTATPPQGFGSLLPMLIFIVPLMLLLFFTSRSQQKKQAAVLASLKKGDRVITQGGLVGRLVEMGDRFVKLEISPGVKVEVLRSNVLGTDTAETQAAAEKK
jgi:preprotein translocase subunit YajC